MDFKNFLNMYNLYQQYQQTQAVPVHTRPQQILPVQYQQTQAIPVNNQMSQALPVNYQYQAPPAQSDNAAIEALSRQLNDMSMRLTSLTLSQNQPGGATEEDMVMGFFDSVINPGGNVGGTNNG